jgi:hypothetical protein
MPYEGTWWSIQWIAGAQRIAGALILSKKVKVQTFYACLHARASEFTSEQASFVETD